MNTHTGENANIDTETQRAAACLQHPDGILKSLFYAVFWLPRIKSILFF